MAELEVLEELSFACLLIRSLRWSVSDYPTGYGFFGFGLPGFDGLSGVPLPSSISGVAVLLR